MGLASEDKQQLRDIIRLLTEIRNLLKSPPVEISGKPAPDDFQRILAERLEARTRTCTCGESKAPCPVHEPG